MISFFAFVLFLSFLPNFYSISLFFKYFQIISLNFVFICVSIKSSYQCLDRHNRNQIRRLFQTFFGTYMNGICFLFLICFRLLASSYLECLFYCCACHIYMYIYSHLASFFNSRATHVQPPTVTLIEKIKRKLKKKSFATDLAFICFWSSGKLYIILHPTCFWLFFYI